MELKSVADIQFYLLFLGGGGSTAVQKTFSVFTCIYEKHFSREEREEKKNKLFGHFLNMLLSYFPRFPRDFVPIVSLGTALLPLS